MNALQKLTIDLKKKTPCQGGIKKGENWWKSESADVGLCNEPAAWLIGKNLS